MPYLKDCPDGHYADASECPYPSDRSGKRFVCHCVEADCSWEVIAPTKEAAIEGWNSLPEKP